MLNISLEVDLQRDDAYRDRALQVLLWTLIHLNELYLRRFPATPKLYESGVRYLREPFGYEQWITVPTIRKQGGADCEDLACWRVAELRVRGFEARPLWLYHPFRAPDGSVGRMYHIKVYVPGWGTEDPSKLLGMKGRA